jgi:hypothetical protein
MQRSNADVVKLKRVGGQCSGALCAILDTLLRFCPALVLALPWSWPCPGPGPGPGPAVTDGLGWLCVLDASLLCASRPGAGCQQGARDRPLEKIRERMLALVTADRVEGAARITIAIAIAISQDGRVNNEWVGVSRLQADAGGRDDEVGGGGGGGRQADTRRPSNYVCTRATSALVALPRTFLVQGSCQ